MENFPIIENGYNTSYIDSLLIALFYKNSSINDILDNEPSIPEAYYLQELIKFKFVNQIKKGYTIFSQSINEIRNYSIICGFDTKGNIDEQQLCIDYYNFLFELFKINPIEFQIFEFNNNVMNNLNILKLPYITFNLTNDNNIRNLFINWLDENVLTKSCNKIQSYKLNNIPNFLIFYIDRFLNQNIKNNYSLDIMNNIKFFNIADSSQSYIKWKIYSIICLKGDSIKNGKYYSVFNINKKEWLLFDNNLIPSFKKIDINDNIIKNDIIKECVIVIYTID
jgi:hypothetical protein